VPAKTHCLEKERFPKKHILLRRDEALLIITAKMLLFNFSLKEKA
jgi:hypothetical protein